MSIPQSLNTIWGVFIDRILRLVKIKKRGCDKNQQPLLLTKKNTYEVTNIET